MTTWEPSEARMVLTSSMYTTWSASVKYTASTFQSTRPWPKPIPLVPSPLPPAASELKGSALARAIAMSRCAFRKKTKLRCTPYLEQQGGGWEADLSSRSVANRFLTLTLKKNNVPSTVNLEDLHEREAETSDVCSVLRKADAHGDLGAFDRVLSPGILSILRNAWVFLYADSLDRWNGERMSAYLVEIARCRANGPSRLRQLDRAGRKRMRIAIGFGRAAEVRDEGDRGHAVVVEGAVALEVSALLRDRVGHLREYLVREYTVSYRYVLNFGPAVAPA